MMVDDLLRLEWNERKAAVEMLRDLRDKGLASRFAKKMHGPMWELKTRSRGGGKGGVRVYFLVIEETAYLVHAEAKPKSTANQQMLLDCVQVWQALTEAEEESEDPQN